MSELKYADHIFDAPHWHLFSTHYDYHTHTGWLVKHRRRLWWLAEMVNGLVVTLLQMRP